MLLLRKILPISFLFVLLGCATQLVPDYDAAAVSKIEATNTKVMQLFSSLDTYGHKKLSKNTLKTLDTIIGEFDAIRVTLDARRVPNENATASKIIMALPFIKQVCGENDKVSCWNPSPGILSKVIKDLRELKTTFSSIPVSGDLLKGFKIDYETDILQVLHVEKLLKDL